MPSYGPSLSPIECSNIEIFNGMTKRQTNQDLIDNIDIIFLIDASKDLSMDEYKQMKISVGEYFDEIVPSVAESSIQFSVIQYGFDVEIVAPLKVRTPEVII